MVYYGNMFILWVSRFSGTPIFQVNASLCWIRSRILTTIPRPESTTLAAALGQVTPCNQWGDGTYTTYLVTGADSFTHTSIYSV